MNRHIASLILVCASFGVASGPATAITIPTVPVGNAGNGDDPHTGGFLGGVNYTGAESEGVEQGFRVATAPEPSMLALFALGTLGLLIAARRRGSINVGLIRSAMRCFAVASLAQLGSLTTLQAAPILWSVGSGGNGHYYEAVSNPINWEAAKSAANARLYLGMNGHLATVASQTENNFLAGNFADSYFLGGLQPTGSAEPAGGWAWVTGEPWNYTNWAAGEPNNSSGNEKYLEFFISGPKWNDTSIQAIRNYIVEYDVPEPSTLAIATFGVVGLLIAARRKKKTPAAGHVLDAHGDEWTTAPSADPRRAPSCT